MDSIRIVEVGPRDGLQNEASFVPTEVKIQFVNALSETGLGEIEVSSFVSPKWVPQLADAEQVFRGIERRSGVTYSALVPNEAGLERAHEARADKIAVFTAASETFSRKNTNASIAENLKRFKPVVRNAGVPVRGYISTAFHCPYEGRITPKQVLPVAQALIDLGCSELSIGDTIGTATPGEVQELLGVLQPHTRGVAVALHFHDTFGNAIANVRAAAELGITAFDGSAGGVGGCPYAPGAPGNVATEVLVEEFGQRTGVDKEKLERASRYILRP